VTVDQLIERLYREAEIAERNARVCLDDASSEREKARAHAYRHAAELARQLRVVDRLENWRGAEQPEL